MELRLENVSYTYKGKYKTTRAVNGVSCIFDNGKMYAIVGASGSGKSTLLSLLAGLRLPTEGSVYYGGESTKKLNRSKLRRETVSVIYQDFNLFPLLTVEENVMYPLRIRKQPAGEAKATANEKLLAVGLKEEQFDRLPNMLSGGEQQRVAIARSLAAGSEIILADEPTGNLDSGNSENIISTLCSLAHKENRCVIVVTHDSAVADAADVVLNMRDGTLSNV